MTRPILHPVHAARLALAAVALAQRTRGGENRFDYVTSPVSPAVTDLYNAVVTEAAKAASFWTENGFERSSQTFNGVTVKVG